jgi:hypothetical protein
MIRDVPPIPDGMVLVRALFDAAPGDAAFERGTLIEDVEYNFELFDYFGLSVWGVSDAWPLNRVVREKACRARRVALFPAAALRRRGLGLVPSGREPHWDVSFGPVYGDMFGAEDTAEVGAGELVDRLLGAPYTVQENGYYEQDLT